MAVTSVSRGTEALRERRSVCVVFPCASMTEPARRLRGGDAAGESGAQLESATGGEGVQPANRTSRGQGRSRLTPWLSGALLVAVAVIFGLICRIGTLDSRVPAQIERLHQAEDRLHVFQNSRAVT